MILGESQIQRQIKDAFVIATEAQTVGKLFRHLFSAALRAGKRIRTDTGISEGCITPGQAALKLANESLGSLAQRSAVLIGSGKIATLTAKAFRDQGIRDLVVVNRTQERADAMVEEIGVGTVASWNDLRQSLVSSDVVISSTGSVDPIVGAKWMRSVQKDRGNRPLAIVDLAVPRDFEPEIGKISAVNLFNFDDLNTVIEQNISERHRLVPMAEEIIQRELRAFHGRVFYLEVDPVLKHVIERFEQIRLGELQKHISQFPPEYHPLVMELTSSLVKKLLHFPIEKLKSLRDLKGLSEQEVAFLKRLFLTRP
jgi:glutamyl-tRNA reductase